MTHWSCVLKMYIGYYLCRTAHDNNCLNLLQTQTISKKAAVNSLRPLNNINMNRKNFEIIIYNHLPKIISMCFSTNIF